MSDPCRLREPEPPSALFLRLDPNAGRDQRSRRLAWLTSVLEHCCWRSHVSITGLASSAEWNQLEAIVRVTATHLDRHPFAVVVLHPEVAVAPSHPGDTEVWSRMLEAAHAYQLEAYHEQGESRLLIAPIVTATDGAGPADLARGVRFFRDRSAPPMLAVREAAAPPELAEDALDLRVLAGFPASAWDEGLVDRLGVHHVVDGALACLADGGGNLLEPCPRHLVLDETCDRIFPCVQAWRGQDPGQPVLVGAQPGTWPPEAWGPTCRRCIASSTLAAGPDLVVSRRTAEGRELAVRLAVSLAQYGEPALAAELAGTAAELSGSDTERAVALIHSGLSLLECGRLREADEALQRADESTDDHGLIALHRGRVQVAWRDDIEALERFDEALAHASSSVPAADIHFLMAQSHVRLEEYDEARAHLASAAAPGREAQIAFFHGICDLNQERLETALSHFEEAAQLGPGPDDLGRVLLYLGTCLSRLDRHDEAIAVLRQAASADPDELAVVNQLGYCYYRLKRHEEAVACFRRAVELDPRSAIDWANLGSNLRDLGRVGEALEMYRRALALDPTIGFARENLERLDPR